MRLKIFACAVLGLFLAGCTAIAAFPIKLPPSKVLNEDYKAWKHQLAENPEYHFSLLLPKDWKILQTSIAKEPEGDSPLELALFREPGAWMENPALPQEGEIVAEVFNLSGSLISGGTMHEAPSAWLKNKLKKSLPGYQLLHERTYVSAYGPAADFLISSGHGQETILSRMTAFHSPKNPQKIFVITSSATQKGYAHVAEAFLVAIGTLRFDGAPIRKTATGSSVSSQPKVSTGAIKLQLKM